MTDPTKKGLHEVWPREQSGVRTGAKYEYQYQRAASASLQLLAAASGVACLYCEWHDDYVVEFVGEDCTRYAFHQVKTRQLASGPWRFRELFGLAGKKRAKSPRAAKDTSIVGRMFLHFRNFNARCRSAVLVTNHDVEPDVATFMVDIKKVATSAELVGETQKAFLELSGAYVKAFENTSPEEVFEFLHRMTVLSEQGSESDLRANYIVLGADIQKVSEVEVTVQHASQIARDLVNVVRDRSHALLEEGVAVTEPQLRATKGVVAHDLLPVLSLSAEGYDELRTKEPNAIKTLSRLQRVAKKLKMGDALVADLCRLKVEWDEWLRENRHHLEPIDVTLIRQRASALLTLHNEGKLEFPALKKEAQGIVAEFDGKLPQGVHLSERAVIGCVLAIFAEWGTSE